MANTLVKYSFKIEFINWSPNGFKNDLQFYVKSDLSTCWIKGDLDSTPPCFQVSDPCVESSPTF